MPREAGFPWRQVSPCEASMRRTTVCPWLCARMSVMVVIWGCFLSTGRIRGLSAHGRHGFVLQWCGAKSLLQRSNAACGYSRLPGHGLHYKHIYSPPPEVWATGSSIPASRSMDYNHIYFRLSGHGLPAHLFTMKKQEFLQNYNTGCVEGRCDWGWVPPHPRPCPGKTLSPEDNVT